MAKTTLYLLKEQWAREVELCINKKCKIIHEKEQKNERTQILAVHPTIKGRSIHRLLDSEEFDKLMIDEGFYLYIYKK